MLSLDFFRNDMK